VILYIVGIPFRWIIEHHPYCEMKNLDFNPIMNIVLPHITLLRCIDVKEEWIMASERKYCSICAWRASCNKRFSITTDAMGCVRCPDYTRDLAIKDKDIEEAEKKYRSKN
jgi:hypothetical protein